MRHIISILVSNEAGALARVAALFSTRGYNIESLNVAPTQNPDISRLTLVTRGSDTVIEQINQQLLKLVDVVGSVDLTMDDHIERELLLLKANVLAEQTDFVLDAVDDFGARVLDDKLETYTLELTGISACRNLAFYTDRQRSAGEKHEYRCTDVADPAGKKLESAKGGSSHPGGG